MIGTHNCGNTLQGSFKRHADYNNVLYLQYYKERVVSSFSHQIQSEYYVGKCVYLRNCIVVI